MKGYRMVLLVNGGLFLLTGLLGLVFALALQAQADRCASNDAATPRTCDQTSDAATTAFRVGPALLGAGFILLALALVLGRRQDSTRPPNEF